MIFIDYSSYLDSNIFFNNNYNIIINVYERNLRNQGTIIKENKVYVNSLVKFLSNTLIAFFPLRFFQKGGSLLVNAAHLIMSFNNNQLTTFTENFHLISVSSTNYFCVTHILTLCS